MSDTVILETSRGRVTLQLHADKAPETVANFLRYVDAGHYSGTLFHRVIPGFMAQGGGFDGNYDKKPVEAPIQNEADNGTKNLRGTVAMARTSDPHSATAQFFVNLVDNDFLDHTGKAGPAWGYCVFAEVSDGMDVIDAISGVPTGAQGPFSKDAPIEPVTIVSAQRG